MKVSVLLIGLGNMGKKYLQKFNQLGLKPALCDIDYSLKFHYPNHVFYGNHSEVYGNHEKVFIMVDPKDHCKIAEYFLSKGSFVFLEKPPSTSYKEFLSLVNKYKEKILGISEIERYSPVFEGFKLTSDITRIDIKRLNKGKGYINPLWDLGWHDLYLLFSLNPKLSISIEKLSEKYPFHWYVEGILTFDNKEIPFSLETAWNYKGKAQREWHIHKENGRKIILDFLNNCIKIDTLRFRKNSVDKLLLMIRDVLKEEYSKESIERALKILKILEEINPP